MSEQHIFPPAEQPQTHSAHGQNPTQHNTAAAGLPADTPQTAEPATLTPPDAPQSPAPQAPRPRRRVSFWRLCLKLALGLTVALAVLTGGLLAFLRTDYGTESARYIGVQVFEWFDIVGLKLEIDSLEGPLPFQLTAKGVRMRDMDGLWLDVGYVHAELDAGDFFAGLLRGELYLHGRTVETRDAHMIRIPVFPDSPAAASPPEAPSAPAPFTLFPAWLRILADNVDVRNAHVEPAVSYYGVFGHAHGSARVEAMRGDARLGVACAFPEQKDSLRPDAVALTPSKSPLEWPFPAGTTAGGTVIDAQAVAGGTSKAAPAEFPDAAPDSVEGALRLVWEGTRFGLTIEATDNTFVRRYAPIAQTARFRLAAQYSMPVVPPVPQQGLTLDSQLEAHFSGPKLPAGGRTLTTQFYGAYDGEKLLIGPARLESPDADGRLRLLLAGGMADQGNGMVINGEAQELATLFSLFSPEERSPVGGGLKLCLYTGTGQDWWQHFLNSEEPFSQATLDCARRGALLQETAPDNTRTAAGSRTGQQTGRQPASAQRHAASSGSTSAAAGSMQNPAVSNTSAATGSADAAPANPPRQRLLLDVTSTLLTLPAGPIKDLHVSAGGEGTGDSWLTPLLPAQFAGNLRGTAANVFNAGKAATDLRWTWDLRQQGQEAFTLDKLETTLPGLRLTGALASAGHDKHFAALPLMQGKLDAAVTDWQVLGKLGGLAGFPLRGGPASAQLRLDTAQQAQQVKAHVQLQEFSCPAAALQHLQLEAQVGDIYGLALPPAAGASNSPVELRLRAGAGHAGGLDWTAATMDAHSRQALVDFSLGMQGELDAKLRGTLRRDTQEITFQECALRAPALGAGLSLRHPAVLALREGLGLKNADFSVSPQGSVSLEALFRQDALTLHAQTRQLPLGLLRPLWDAAALPDGDINAEINFKGTPQHPSGTVSLALENIRQAEGNGLRLVADLPSAVRAQGKLEERGGRHTLNMRVAVDGWGTAADDEFTATARLPLRFAPAPALDMRAPAAADVFWRGDVEKIWRYLPLPGRRLRGRGQAEVHVQGSLHAPRLDAALFLGKAHFVDRLLGVKLRNIDMEARYSTHGESVLRLRAEDTRHGTLAINGSLTSDPKLGPFNLAGLQVRGQGVISRLRPLHRDDLSAQISGDLAVEGPLGAPAIRGNLHLDEVVYTVQGFGGTSVTELSPLTRTNSFDLWRQGLHSTAQAKPAAGGPSLDVHVNAPGKIFIRGKGLNSEWKAELHVSGAAGQPAVVGQVEPVRGTFDILGKEFNFKKGAIRFTGPVLPALDVGLTYQAQNVVAEILVRGSASRPRLELTSQPAMPRDEVMAQILFDKNANELNRFQLIQAANTARTLVSGKPDALDLLGKTRDLLGFEVLRVGSSSSGAVKKNAPTDASVKGKTESADDAAPTLEAGKYLFDNVYVGVEQGTGQQGSTSVHVDIDVLPNVSVTGRTSNTSSNVGVNWKMDY